MAVISDDTLGQGYGRDARSGTSRAHSIDRWIYVITAAIFLIIVFTGFIPDSIEKMAAVKAGTRPPLPLVMHIHATLMGSYLLLFFTHTVLVATGNSGLHRRLGLVSMVLAPALVVAGFVLAAVNYHSVWNAAHFGPPAVRAQMAAVPAMLDNILLVQIRVGVLFPLFLAMGLLARGRDDGFHKRKMILATLVPLPAAIDRIQCCQRRCRGARSPPISTCCWRSRRCSFGT